MLKNKTLSKKLYKSFMREAQAMSRQNRVIWINQIPHFNEFQTFHLLPVDRSKNILHNIFPKKLFDLVETEMQTQCLDGNKLKLLCRKAFSVYSNDAIDAGFESYRKLLLQVFCYLLI